MDGDEDKVDTLGECVIFERLQRDNVLRYLNPYRMSDLKAIISLLIASKDPPVLDKGDLVEVVWKRQNKFLLPGDFVLKNWEDMTLKQLQLAVEDAHPTIFDNETLYPSYRTPVRQLTTKEAIMREYGCLEYIPGIVYCTYRGAMEVLEKMKTISGIMDLREDPAAAEGYFEFACQAGMDLDIIRKFLDVYHVDLANTEGIHLAAGCGHLDVVKLLIEEYGADIEQRDLDEMPPLLNAAENAHTEIVTYLLERGADIEAADSHGAGLVHVAAQSLNVEFIRTLVEEHDLDASATDNKGTTAVHYSAMNGDIPMVRFLVEELNVPFVREARTEAPETRGGSLLMTVAATEYTEMFRWLVDNYGLDPMSKDWKQCSLIFDAARSGKDCMVDFLIREYGLDPTEVDDEGCLPTFDAASQGHFHTIQNLVDNHGVDPHHVDSFGQSILFVAAAMGDEQLFDLIVDTYDVDMETPDENGMAAIDYLEEFLANPMGPPPGWVDFGIETDVEGTTDEESDDLDDDSDASDDSGSYETDSEADDQPGGQFVLPGLGTILHRSVLETLPADMQEELVALFQTIVERPPPRVGDGDPDGGGDDGGDGDEDDND